MHVCTYVMYVCMCCTYVCMCMCVCTVCVCVHACMYVCVRMSPHVFGVVESLLELTIFVRVQPSWCVVRELVTKE